MKTKLLIEVDCDGTYCGSCEAMATTDDHRQYCEVFSENLTYDETGYVRFIGCLAAESAARDESATGGRTP